MGIGLRPAFTPSSVLFSACPSLRSAPPHCSLSVALWTLLAGSNFRRPRKETPRLVDLLHALTGVRRLVMVRVVLHRLSTKGAPYLFGGWVYGEAKRVVKSGRDTSNALTGRTRDVRTGRVPVVVSRLPPAGAPPFCFLFGGPARFLGPVACFLSCPPVLFPTTCLVRLALLIRSFLGTACLLLASSVSFCPTRLLFRSTLRLGVPAFLSPGSRCASAGCIGHLFKREPGPLTLGAAYPPPAGSLQVRALREYLSVSLANATSMRASGSHSPYPRDTREPVRADSTIASVISTTRRPSRPEASGSPLPSTAASKARTCFV